MDQSIEQWRPVLGYEGTHEVSDQGRVRSLSRAIVRSDGHVLRHRGRVLATKTVEHSGHRAITLVRNGVPRTHTVHKLVLEAFVGQRPEGLMCRHLNGVPHDNRLQNLRWGTLSENTLDSVAHGTHNQASKTTCPLGHELKDPNLVKSGVHGQRRCKACMRERDRASAEGRPFDRALADKRYADVLSGRNRTVKLTPRQVAEIRRRYLSGETQVSLAREYGVVQPHVSRIVRGTSRH